MYLINAKTYELEYFVGASIPKYAILSHVWGKEEVLFQDMKDLESAQKKKGFLKIQLTCQQALQDGLSYAWVDTCCINKESSAELSEAINSMFRWYFRADRCYAYLADIEVLRNDETGLHMHPPFADSVWFTRGWTLQELIAPEEVTFMDQNWASIGTKTEDLLDEIHQATGVDRDVLIDSSTMFRMTVAKRMSWAAKRKTTRKEDEAYCLLGLFDVNMPMLYGEEEGAFVRLQEELIRQTTDQSIFVHRGYYGDLLASSPSDFMLCTDVEPGRSAFFADQPYELTNLGLRISLPVLFSTEEDVVVVLNCHRNHRRLTMSLRRIVIGNNTILFRARYRDRETGIETLLACPFEDLFIARRYGSHDRRFFDPPSGYAPVSLVWISTPNRNEGEDLDIAITALEPPELWDVATPVHKSVTTRIGGSVRRANFALYDSPGMPPDEGSITFKLTQSDLESVVLGIRFKILPKRDYPQVYFLCNLELYEIRTAHADHLEPVSHEYDSSVKYQWLSDSSNFALQVSIAIKRLKVTALLEAIPSANGSLNTLTTMLLLELRVNQMGKSALLPSEAHESTT